MSSEQKKQNGNGMNHEILIAWFIGILILIYHNPYITAGSASSPILKQPTKVFEGCSSSGVPPSHDSSIKWVGLGRNPRGTNRFSLENCPPLPNPKTVPFGEGVKHHSTNGVITWTPTSKTMHKNFRWNRSNFTEIYHVFVASSLMPHQNMQKSP